MCVSPNCRYATQVPGFSSDSRRSPLLKIPQRAELFRTVAQL
jgi:hypothetical protein